MGEYGASGQAVQETVYLGDIPVAVAKQGTLYPIYADHLGIPSVITDASQREIWRWEEHEPFGNSLANEDPDSDGVKFEYHLRFPGQYFDVETGLHYNYFRDYDPSTGRYVESDPIGLAGGLNTYGYVGGNPVNGVDLFGLQVLPFPIPVPLPPIGGGTGGVGGYDWEAPFWPQWIRNIVARAIPQPSKPKRGVTCTCRASSSGQQAGNCPESEYAFGTANAPTAREARAEAERIARKNLGKQAKHTQCKCTDYKGNPVYPDR